jgi:hypothetical protein
MSIRSLVLILAAAVMITFALAQTTTNTRDFNLPPVGLGATETAEISVTNLAANASDGTAASCSGSILFHNSGGSLIGSATAFTIASGQISSARLPFSSAGATGTRTLIRGTVQLTLASSSPRPPCSLAFSLATYDTSTGATHALESAGLGPGYGPGPGRRE